MDLKAVENKGWRIRETIIERLGEMKMNNKDVKERTKIFIDELGVPATVFAKKIGISATAYHRWMKNDLKLSESTEKRIENYLLKYGF